MVNRTSLDTNDFIHQNRNYSLYQNPVSSGEYVEIKNITDTANFNFNYAIINQSGQIIDMKMNHQGKITAPFTQGIYYVRFQNEEKEDIVKKLIVK